MKYDYELLKNSTFLMVKYFIESAKQNNIFYVCPEFDSTDINKRLNMLNPELKKVKFIRGKFKATFFQKFGDLVKQRIAYDPTHNSFSFSLGYGNNCYITFVINDDYQINIEVYKNYDKIKTFETGIRNNEYLQYLDIRCTLGQVLYFIQDLLEDN